MNPKPSRSRPSRILHSAFCILHCAFCLTAFAGDKVIKNGDTLVFMGDSITQFGKDTEAGYLRLVVRGLEANGVRVTWHGAGISGNTSAQMRARFQKDVIDRKPQVVTILAGVNDCLGGWPEKTASTPDDVSAMADMAIEAGITPVLLSPTGGAVETFPQPLLDYVAAVRDMAKAKGVPYGATHEALRAYVENPVNPAISLIGYPWKACSDGLHMDIVGNRIIAREIMKALGFGSPEEVAKTEAAWNAIPGIVQFHPCVKVTKAEYEAVKAAARREGKSLAAYHADLFARGVEIMKANPAQVKPTDGADVEFSVSPYANLVTYDTLLDCGRAMAGHDSLPKMLNYATLAAIHELPPATEADIPKEPVRAVDASVFAKSVAFTVSGYTGSSTLKDFPVAVRLADGSPAVFRYADMADASRGAELRFADGAGRSLSYEIERWNPGGESLIWVRIPSLAKGTKFTMHYGGRPGDVVEPRSTWSAGYVGVWHMAEEGGVVADSTPNGLDAVPKGNAASKQVAADGVLGKARVNSTSSHTYSGQAVLQVDDSTPLNVGGDFTVSGWVRMTAAASGKGLARIFCRNRNFISAPDWQLYITGYDVLNVQVGKDATASGAIPSAENAWVHIAGVFDGTNFTAYANGEKVFGAAVPPVTDSDHPLVFGSNDRRSWQGHFTGLFDEFRLRDAASSADWVKAEYDQASPGFLTTNVNDIVMPPVAFLRQM